MWQMKKKTDNLVLGKCLLVNMQRICLDEDTCNRNISQTFRLAQIDIFFL